MLKRTTSFAHRLSLIFFSHVDLQDQLQAYLTDERTCPGLILPQTERSTSGPGKYKLCCIYSGQGPQWWAMGRQLYISEPKFRQWIEKLHDEFLQVSNGSFLLIDELIRPEREEDSQINHTNIAQPTILAIQIALTALWTSWGIRPSSVVGHSVGEVAAAFVAGRLTLREAVEIIYHRSRVQNYNTNQGGRMLALFLGEEETKSIIEPYADQVQIGAINSSKSMTLSGDGEILQLIFDTTMQAILEKMTESNGIPVFLELSAHSVLSTAIPECFHRFARSHSVAPFQTPLTTHSLKRKEDEEQTILSSLCQLYVWFGSEAIDWTRFSRSREKETDHSPLGSLLDQLPHYSFNEQICWSESKDSVFTRRAHRRKHHPLLGYRQWANEARTPTWKNILLVNKSSPSLSYLFDRVVQGRVLFPASAFIELVIAGINQLLSLLSSAEHQSSITLRNIQLPQGLLLSEETSIQLETVIVMPFKEFFIYSRQRQANESVRLSGINGEDISPNFADETSLHLYSSKEWTLHCRGSIHLDVDGSLISSLYQTETILQRFSSKEETIAVIDENEPDDIRHFYQYLDQCGLHYGPQFQCVKSFTRRDQQALAEIQRPASLSTHQAYHCHPAVLDSCFQVMVAMIPGKFYETGIPISIDELTVCRRTESLLSVFEQSAGKLYAFHSLKSSVKGLNATKTFQSDLLIFQSEENRPHRAVDRTLLRSHVVDSDRSDVESSPRRLLADLLRSSPSSWTTNR